MNKNVLESILYKSESQSSEIICDCICGVVSVYSTYAQAQKDLFSSLICVIAAEVICFPPDMHALSYKITAWMLIFSSEFVSRSTQMSYKRRCFNMISLFPFNVCNKFMKGGEYKEKKNKNLNKDSNLSVFSVTIQKIQLL